MTDSRLRASRALGKVQRFLPEITVNLLRSAIAVEIEQARADAGIPSAMLDPAAKAVIDAHAKAIEILLDERIEWEERLARSLATIKSHYRGVSPK